MTTQHQEYIVTVHNAADLDDIYNELESLGCGCHNHFPERAIECLHRRPISRGTHYLMTAEEAEMIKQDPRVWDVELHPREKGYIKELHWTQTSSNWNKFNGNNVAADRNWGLLRCFEGTHRSGWGAFSTHDAAGTVTVYGSGLHVDFVDVDGLIDPAHPEFAKNADGTGGSRVTEYDWFAQHNAEVWPGNPQSNYQYNNFDVGDNLHGNHTAGTVAGNTQGWARDINIYNINPIDSDNLNFPTTSGDAYVFDYIRAFHRNKAVNPITGVKNPTITNNSWGWSGSEYTTNIKNVVYRGTTYTTSTSFSDAQLNGWGVMTNGGLTRFGVRQTYLDADVADALAEGIIIIGSAGNSSNKNDVLGGPDYNNVAYIGSIDPFNAIYYNRGSSPSAAPGVICVGAIDGISPDRKASYSNSGPRVDVWAPGSYIVSSFTAASNYPGYPTPVADPRNSSYYYARLSGTSMAGPQVTGILSCVLEKHRSWTQTDVLSYLPSLYNTSQITDTGGNAGDFFSLQGASNRYLKVPAELLTATVTVLTATVVTPSLSFTVNQSITPVVPVTASGGTTPYAYNISPGLPTGMTFGLTSGQIGGTPNIASSTASYNITVSDSLLAKSTGTVSIYVAPLITDPLVTTLTTSTRSLIINETITPFIPVTATGGSGTRAWSVNTPFPTGLTFNTANGQLSGTPSVISTSRSYTITVNDSTTSSSKVFALGVASIPVVTTLVIPTRNLTALQTVTPFIPVTATGGSNTLVWSINTPLPSGLSFNTSNGQISGTPSNVVTPSAYVISVTDGYTTDSEIFTLGSFSTPLVTTLNVSSTSFLIDSAITPFTPVTATGGNGTLTWSVDTLPSGLTLNTSNGQISGTPISLYSASSFTVTVTDQLSQSSSKAFTLSILPVPLVTTRQIVRKIVLTDEYQSFIPAIYSGGYGVVSWSVVPTLPNGFTLNSATGAISGSSSALSLSSQYTLTAADQAGQTSSQSFVLRIKSPLHLVFADEQTKVYDALFSLIGTTATGYGSTLLSRPVEPGDVVEPDNWNLMGQDVIRCVIHQYGTAYNTPSPYDLDIGNILSANTGTIVDDAGPDRMYTNIQFLTSTSATAHPSQLVTDPIYPETTGPDTWDSVWEANRWQEVSYSNGYGTAMSFTWSYPLQLNYFFNLGGILNPNITISGIHPVEVAEWQVLVNQLNAIDFGKAEFYETLADNNKTYTRVLTKDKVTGSPYNKAIIMKYMIVGSVLTFAINFVAGFTKLKLKGDKVKGKWSSKDYSKGKKILKKGGKGTDILVNLRIRADVLTTYSTNANGGIQAPVPQPQLVGGFLSAPTAPIPPFTFATGDQSPTRTITLRNNSMIPCVVSDITLTGPGNGYSTGVVSTTTMVIEPIGTGTFDVYYTGDTPGYNRGYIYINSNINPVVLFTEINVGGVTPTEWIVTTTTNATMVQEFTVDHAGGNYRGFDVSISGAAGFTCIPHIPGAEFDKFSVTFNPAGKSNGVYSTTATVIIHPLDISLGDITALIPISITRNVRDQHLGSWISARGYMNEVIGFSYDWIGGIKYLTIGLGVNSALTQLRTLNTFGTWDEVYRIEITGEAKTYHTNGNIIKSQDFFDGNTIGYQFGVGSALNSICTIKDNGSGNLSIVINTVRGQTGDTVAEGILTSLANAFYYYDETVNRVTQLESLAEFTRFFIGFGASGATKTKLVNPNLL